jgi:hypothetical protein
MDDAYVLGEAEMGSAKKREAHDATPNVRKRGKLSMSSSESSSGSYEDNKRDDPDNEKQKKIYDPDISSITQESENLTPTVVCSAYSHLVDIARALLSFLNSKEVQIQPSTAKDFVKFFRSTCADAVVNDKRAPHGLFHAEFCIILV